VIVFSWKFGHCHLQTLWDTLKVVTGLECLADSHFPRNCISADVRVGKTAAADKPSRAQFHLVCMKCGIWIPLVLSRRLVYMVTAIINLSLVAIQHMSSHMVMPHHLKFRSFRSSGMLTSHFSWKSMATLVYSAVIMHPLMFHQRTGGFTFCSFCILHLWCTFSGSPPTVPGTSLQIVGTCFFIALPDVWRYK
jgi:hypothetical protein